MCPSSETRIKCLPAALTLSVLFAIGNPAAVVPLHCTTVPFSLDVVLNVRVEVRSATSVLIIVMGFAVFVKVATKSMLSHCGGETSLQFTLIPTGVVSNWNRVRVLPVMYGSTIQSSWNPWLMVQVYVTISPGQTCLIPRLESRTTVAVYKTTWCVGESIDSPFQTM